MTLRNYNYDKMGDKALSMYRLNQKGCDFRDNCTCFLKIHCPCSSDTIFFQLILYTTFWDRLFSLFSKTIVSF